LGRSKRTQKRAKQRKSTITRKRKEEQKHDKNSEKNLTR
jgi:hypothetical protein